MQRHHGLARADITLQEPQHAFGLGEVVDDLGDGAGLRIGQRIGQGFAERPAQAPVAEGRAACRPAQMSAHECKRKLAGQEFVIGEPRPGGAAGIDVGGLMRAMQRA